MLPCDECYKFTLSACPESDKAIVFRPSAGMTEGEHYYWFVEDKFNHFYLGVSQFSGGHIDIPVDEFPEGFFIDASGSFTVSFAEDAYNQNQVEVTLGGSARTCISLDFKSMNIESLTVI